MDASEETTTKSVTALEEEEEPSDSQFAKDRGLSYSLTWKKVLVYDCEQQIVRVKSEKSIDHHWPKIDLPSKCKQIVIYVDSETESKPTIESRGADGKSNVELATLYLNRLGAYYQVLRSLGLLSTLYVANAAPWSETSSRIVGGRKPGDRGE